jgi:N6-adenosine-specific RNA methylase IME4
MSEQALLPTLSTAAEAQTVHLERARQALQEARSVGELKRIRDQAEAVRVYARQRRLGRDLVQGAAAIKLWAEWRIGEISRDLPKAHPGRVSDLVTDSVTKCQLLQAAGIHPSRAAEYERLARIDEEVFGHYLREMEASSREPTSSGVLTIAVEIADLPVETQRDAIQRVIDKRAATIRTAIRQIQGDWPAAPDLPAGQYAVIVADPPWAYSNTRDIPSQRGTTPYAPMTQADICALPVSDLAGADCVLWLWTTNAHMPDAFQVLAEWGFTHKTILTWVKNRIGLGRWLRGQTEHCLLAVRGKPAVRLTNQPTVLMAPVREHSRKPDEFYALVDELCIGSKVELFARETRPGWDGWGHERELFDAG